MTFYLSSGKVCRKDITLSVDCFTLLKQHHYQLSTAGKAWWHQTLILATRARSKKSNSTCPCSLTASCTCMLAVTAINMHPTTLHSNPRLESTPHPSLLWLAYANVLTSLHFFLNDSSIPSSSGWSREIQLQVKKSAQTISLYLFGLLFLIKLKLLGPWEMMSRKKQANLQWYSCACRHTDLGSGLHAGLLLAILGDHCVYCKHTVLNTVSLPNSLTCEVWANGVLPGQSALTDRAGMSLGDVLVDASVADWSIRHTQRNTHTHHDTHSPEAVATSSHIDFTQQLKANRAGQDIHEHSTSNNHSILTKWNLHVWAVESQYGLCEIALPHQLCSFSSS